MPRKTFRYWWHKFNGDCVQIKAVMDVWKRKEAATGIVRGDLAYLMIPKSKRPEEVAKGVIYGKDKAPY